MKTVGPSSFMGLEHFVLDIAKDPCAAVALDAYAGACAGTDPQLAVELRKRAQELRRRVANARVRAAAPPPDRAGA